MSIMSQVLLSRSQCPVNAILDRSQALPPSSPTPDIQDSLGSLGGQGFLSWALPTQHSEAEPQQNPSKPGL